jgi:Protein of unknown function (DUF3309)
MICDRFASVTPSCNVTSLAAYAAYDRFADLLADVRFVALSWNLPIRSRVGNGLDVAETVAMLGTILIIVLILLLIGALPTWPYSASWGFYPGSGLGLILVIVIILVLMGRI